jgi:hypothetical protein
MTTLAVGSSVTVAVRDGGTVAIATNGGLASAVVTLTEGGTQTVSLGPLTERRTLGPYAEGASIVITNSSCGAFDYDAETRTDPSSVAITGGTIVNAPVTRIQYVLAQTGVPTILPSSGSSNATGQITLTTALPSQPAGTVQVWMPAGVVVGDATGGLYPAVFSSASVCQLVGNPVTANAAYTQTTSAVGLVSVSVPGGVMGANGSLRISPQWTIPNNANNKTMTARFGGQSAAVWLDTTVVQETRDVRIRNRGSLLAQITSSFVGYATTSTAPISLTVDTSQAQAAVLQAQLAVATDYVILEAYTVEVLPSN